MKLKIIKPKTRPIQIEPWFFKYLNEGQLKVVAAILSHADIKDRQSNSFPSNRVIAFYCGFGDIKEGSKAYEEYQKLNDEEKIKFKNKKIKTAIITVANIKKQLETMGLLKREFVGPKGKQIVYMNLDLEWKKEQYLKEHDEFFNDVKYENNEDEKENIAKELEELQRLTLEGNISQENLANRLKNLSYKIDANNTEKSQVPLEDIDKVATYIMNTTKIQNKIDEGTIENKEAYKKSIIKSISNNTFNGIEKYYEALVKKEEKDMLETLTVSLEENEKETFYQKNILYFKDLIFTNNIFLATYQTKDKKISKQYIISNEKIKYYLHSSYFYTKQNKELLDNYNQAIKDYQEMLQKPQEESTSNTS
ncbi:hypothetical protein PJV92_06400 [Aliarcobacter butzleri]|uniref:Uncharacterized protein n=1 Tax=Aliarcobacter butzleri TaxID=28197 RepID=A0AAP4UYS1_9BACT|nr:hypothetical protein [Aliarcobacter butzleri]MDN5052228.1 hypothetical protein [Aliarcobacter butzleri]MDN5075690.1 hypothetical protein [Aliarcobacter butzleri]MDN5116487.1 hypothetical protein [Aliarcobacter butzleri]MDN5132351.1 hypothetical protein [Aliarcobacter butzleri]